MDGGIMFMQKLNLTRPNRPMTFPHIGFEEKQVLSSWADGIIAGESF